MCPSPCSQVPYRNRAESHQLPTFLFNRENTEAAEGLTSVILKICKSLHCVMFYLTISYIHFDTANLKEISYSLQTRVLRSHSPSLPSLETPHEAREQGTTQEKHINLWPR